MSCPPRSSCVNSTKARCSELSTRSSRLRLPWQMPRSRPSRQSTGARRAWRSSMLEEPRPPQHRSQAQPGCHAARRGSAGAPVNAAGTPHPATAFVWLVGFVVKTTSSRPPEPVPRTGSRSKACRPSVKILHVTPKFHARIHPVKGQWLRGLGFEVRRTRTTQIQSVLQPNPNPGPRTHSAQRIAQSPSG
jgi:hypothetical protein